MNLIKGLALLAAASTLAACQTDETDAPVNGVDEIDGVGEVEETEEDIETYEEDDDPADAIVTDQELEPVSDEELDNAELIDDLSQYEEFEEQDVLNLDEYDAYLLSDEGGRREIIFTENDEQIFKSIFIIEDNNLRIIDLMNAEVLINDPI